MEPRAPPAGPGAATVGTGAEAPRKVKNRTTQTEATPTFVSLSFTTAKVRKPLEYPWTEEGIKKTCRCVQWNATRPQRAKIWPFCDDTGGPRGTEAE